MKYIHNAVRALAVMASLGVALSTTPALAQVWQASTDYSTDPLTGQGYLNWRYMTFKDSNYDPMVYGSNGWGFDSWHGNEAVASGSSTCIVYSAVLLHPDRYGLFEAARVWESPVAGTVRMTGTVGKADDRGGNGVHVSIWKNATELLWEQDLAYDNSIGYSFDFSVSVLKGDYLAFRVGAIGSNSDNDTTYFDPKITLESLDSSASGSWIEDVLNAESSYVQGLALSLFDGPTSHAQAGRRLAVSHAFKVAANLVAVGNNAAAIAELLRMSERLDGDPSPPDWMFDGPEKAALCSDIQQLIYLLGLP